ncbi:hypothetical protein [Streptomyces parvus]|uniref:hypothetical protein n=1 Tax=Streptomyces parvus TaxID=66428 RepID=UPI0033FEE1B1
MEHGDPVRETGLLDRLGGQLDHGGRQVHSDAVDAWVVSGDADEALPRPASEVGNLLDGEVGQDRVEEPLDLLLTDQPRPDGHRAHVAMVEVAHPLVFAGHVRCEAEELATALDQPVEVAACGVGLLEARSWYDQVVVLDLDDLGPVERAVDVPHDVHVESVLGAVSEACLALLGQPVKESQLARCGHRGGGHVGGEQVGDRATGPVRRGQGAGMGRRHLVIPFNQLVQSGPPGRPEPCS